MVGNAVTAVRSRLAACMHASVRGIDDGNGSFCLPLLHDKRTTNAHRSCRAVRLILIQKRKNEGEAKRERETEGERERERTRIATRGLTTYVH